MNDEKSLMKIHPAGERKTEGDEDGETVSSLDTFAGKVQLKWAPEAEVSTLGLMPFFIEFLKTPSCWE